MNCRGSLKNNPVHTDTAKIRGDESGINMDVATNFSEPTDGRLALMVG